MIEKRKFSTGGWKCGRCGSRIPSDGSNGPAHTIPVGDGLENLILCDSCAQTAEATQPIDWKTAYEERLRQLVKCQWDRDKAALLLRRTYDALRSVEKYGDWDAPGYSEAVAMKEEIGEYLWPDEPR